MAAKGYKAFAHGMTCLGKQYSENTIFEESGASACCEAGVMHYCENPLNVLNYYPLIDDNGYVVEIAEVEPLAEVLRKEDKCATKKLRIGAKIKIADLIDISRKYLVDTAKVKLKKATIGGDQAKQVGGNFAKQVGGGFAKQVGGDYAQQVGGSCAKQVGGDSAQQVGGNYAQQIGGSCSTQYAGKNSIIIAGPGSKFKTGLHSIVLYYWFKNENIAGFKAARVDNKKLKADTWYELKGGNFVEVE